MEIMGEKISDKNDPHMFQDEKITNDKQTRFFSVYSKKARPDTDVAVSWHAASKLTKVL